MTASPLLGTPERQALPGNPGTRAGHCHPQYEMQSLLLENTHDEREHCFT